MATDQIRMMPVGDIAPYEGNPRNITPEAVSAVAASIEMYGQQQPIVVDGHGVVVAGHTTLEAVKELGWTEVWVEDMGELPPERAREFRLVDNRTSDLSSWDLEKMAGELDDMGLSDEMEMLPGFEGGELAALASLMDDEAAEDGEVQVGTATPRSPAEGDSGGADGGSVDEERFALLSFHVPKHLVREVKPKIEAILSPYLVDVSGGAS